MRSSLTSTPCMGYTMRKRMAFFIRHISVLLAVPVVGGVFDTIGDVWNVEVDYTIGFRI